MGSTTNNLHVVLKKKLKFDGKKADDFIEWSCKLRASLSIYNRVIFTSCKGKSDRPRPTTVKSLPVRRGMPPTRIYSAYCSLRRAAQPSSSYGESKAPHSRMEQDMDNRRGQRCVRTSKGVRAKQFARSIQK